MQGGKALTWDVTVVSTLVDSYLHASSHSAGGAAEIASVRKESKYSILPPDYIFQPVAFETLGSLNSSGDARETSFLFQRLSILIQRFLFLALGTYTSEGKKIIIITAITVFIHH